MQFAQEITGQPIMIEKNKPVVPNTPIIPFIEGDGSGPDIWRAAKRVLDASVERAYAGSHRLAWMEVFAGGKSFEQFGEWLPESTLQAFRDFHIGIKGPLTTPIGEGMRSLNVALRKQLDLYACVRPVRYFSGVPSPMLYPERVNITLFRENTEDVYSGLDFAVDSPQAQGLLEWLQTHYPEDYKRIRFPQSTAIGIKPISREGSTRLAISAIEWAISNQKKHVTLVHKGNIMKFTEGAFARWSMDAAKSTFGDKIYTQAEWKNTADAHGEAAANQEKDQALQAGRLILDDIITDAMFEKAIAHPEDFQVLVTTNLNGDYLSDALAALVGGIGIAPGANINYLTSDAIFEATHGTAPTLAGKDKANPCSVILSGEMMLRYLGWTEAADLVINGVEGAIKSKKVTADFACQMDSAQEVSTTDFANHMIKIIQG